MSNDYLCNFKKCLRLEDQERHKTVCCGCGKAKSIGIIVCWGCFKYRQDITPFKYFDGSLSEWVALAKGGAK